ncbi:MAG: hypothetical protein KGZ56_05970, partial [Dethiobacter sp.]|nr:hypothetical protein [Dethiobacter sp.]MBS3898492.1 hypothetical protein [Dethiobacter sp.]
RLLIGLEVPSKYDLVASRKKNIRQEAVFILPLVPQAAWVSTQKSSRKAAETVREGYPLGQCNITIECCVRPCSMH